MTEKTLIERSVPSDIPLLQQELHPVLKRIYASRGINCLSEQELELTKLLPFDNLTGVDKACARLALALKEQQRVLIVGDFDADGATSTALAVSALKLFGFAEVDYLVPNRFEYGYGLTPEIVAVAAKWQPALIITVDNGISSHQGVAAAKEKGIDVIVTDHHLAADTLPDAAAIVNPNQPGCQFPSKHLAGVGVIFYTLLAFRRYLQDNQLLNGKPPNMAQFLDLVALGTVADVVVLDRNNRTLVQQGINRIRAGRCRPGILALLDIAKRSPTSVTASDFGFAVAPRLNAAGRLDDMSLGISCLLAKSEAEARQMAEQLDLLNQERREIEQQMRAQAEAIITNMSFDGDLPLGVCLYDPDWHQGVIGILAGRIKETLNRPVIAFAKVNDWELKGSARSVKGLHMRDCLDLLAKKHPELISKFGGHAMAAGLSLPMEHYPAFAKAFAQTTSELLSADQLKDEILTDGALAPKDFAVHLAELIRDAGPWGQGFEEPIFSGRFSIVQQYLVGQKHLKLVLGLNDQHGIVDAIAFNVDRNQWPNHKCSQVDAAFRLDINQYQGYHSLQLIIEHLIAVD